MGKKRSNLPEINLDDCDLSITELASGEMLVQCTKTGRAETVKSNSSRFKELSEKHEKQQKDRRTKQRRAMTHQPATTTSETKKTTNKQ